MSRGGSTVYHALLCTSTHSAVSCLSKFALLAGPQENGYVSELHRGHPAVTSGGETWIEVSMPPCVLQANL